MKKLLSLFICVLIILSLVLSTSAFTTVPVKGIKLDKGNISLNIGQTLNLKVAFTPANTTQKSLKYSSSNKNIATVDTKGIITALTVGKATITVVSSSNNKVTAKCNVTVSEAKKIKLTAFYAHDPDIDQLAAGDPNNTPYQKELQRQTGVTFEYIVSSAQEAADKFRLLLNSGDIPDVFGCVLEVDYPGGKSKALEDGVIVSVNPYLDTICKDYKKALQSNPDYMKNIQDDNGNIFGFAALRSNSSRVYGGPMVRKDLLDKAGISKLPVTIDDWYKALKAIKAAGYTSPLTAQFHWKLEEGGFIGAYGTTGSFAVGTDNKIHLGAIEEGYKQFLTTFAKWYAEGLIDPEFFTVSDGSIVNAKMSDMKTSGACLANVSRIQIVNTAGKKVNPDFNLIGTRYPVLKSGDQVLYGQQDPPVDLRWYVSGKSKDIEACMRYYNFMYTDEGIALSNWGIKDLTYTVKDGKKQYTNEIPITQEKNPKGWTLDQSLKMYCQMAVDAPGVEDGDSFIALRRTYPGQSDSINAWTEFKMSYALPPALSYTRAELIVMRSEQNITDAIRAWRMKFVMGNEPLSKWDEYVKEINKLGAQDVIDVKNDAFERFKKRK